MKTGLIIIVVILLGLAGYALMSKSTLPISTDETSSDDGRVRAPEDMSLSVGQTATIAGLTVTLNTVNDSRCPQGVECIWAGEVTASVTLGLNEETSTVDMKLGADPIEFEGFFVSLTAALPYPKEGISIEQDDHMLTFRVAPVVGSDGDIPADI